MTNEFRNEVARKCALGVRRALAESRIRSHIAAALDEYAEGLVAEHTAFDLEVDDKADRIENKLDRLRGDFPSVAHRFEDLKAKLAEARKTLHWYAHECSTAEYDGEQGTRAQEALAAMQAKDGGEDKP